MGDENPYLADSSGDVPFSLAFVKNTKGKIYETNLDFLLFLESRGRNAVLADVRCLYSPSISQFQLIVCEWNDPELKKSLNDDGFDIPDYWAV